MANLIWMIIFLGLTGLDSYMAYRQYMEGNIGCMIFNIVVATITFMFAIRNFIKLMDED